MITVLLLAVASVYLAGVFPAAVKATRMHAERGVCHHEDRLGGRDSYNNAGRSWCSKFHRPECWRIEEQVTYANLKAAPLALLWPALVVGMVVLRQARKHPSREMLEAQIARLEREAGIAP